MLELKTNKQKPQNKTTHIQLFANRLRNKENSYLENLLASRTEGHNVNGGLCKRLQNIKFSLLMETK